MSFSLFSVCCPNVKCPSVCSYVWYQNVQCPPVCSCVIIWYLNVLYNDIQFVPIYTTWMCNVRQCVPVHMPPKCTVPVHVTEYTNCTMYKARQCVPMYDAWIYTMSANRCSCTVRTSDIWMYCPPVCSCAVCYLNVQVL